MCRKSLKSLGSGQSIVEATQERKQPAPQERLQFVLFVVVRVVVVSLILTVFTKEARDGRISNDRILPE